MRYGRVHWYVPEELDDQQREYYERLLAGPRGAASLVDEEGRLFGAFNARLLDPPVGTALQELGAALRFRTQLPARAREIVILEVARSERCEYEWAAHAEAGRAAGLTDDEIAGLRAGARVSSLSREEARVRAVTQILVAQRDLTDDEFAAAERDIGVVYLFDIVSLVGYYQHTAMALRVWRTPLREGTPETFAAPTAGDADETA